MPMGRTRTLLRVAAAMRRVPRAKAFGQQHLDRAADHLRRRIAEQRGHLAIGEQDRARWSR